MGKLKKQLYLMQQPQQQVQLQPVKGTQPPVQNVQQVQVPKEATIKIDDADKQAPKVDKMKKKNLIIMLLVTILFIGICVIVGIIFYPKSSSSSKCLVTEKTTTKLDFKAIAGQYLEMSPNEMVKDIAKQAYLNTQTTYESNKQTQLDATLQGLSDNIFIGPNSQLQDSLTEDKIKNSIDKIAVLLKEYPQVKTLTLLFFTESDVDWAILKVKEQDFYVNGDSQPNDDEIEHFISQGGNFVSGSANMWVTKIYGVAAIRLPSPDDFYKSGPVIIHEYVHSAQAAPWSNCMDRPAEGYQTIDFVACWITEGQAHFIGYSLYSETEQIYLDYRRDDNRGEKELSKSELKRFIFDFMTPSCDPGSTFYNYGYTAGRLIVEFLSAIQGSQSSFDLLIQVRNGKEWITAFGDIYGVIDEADKDLFVDIIYLMIQTDTID